jgi:DNA-binding winged helix-turn-helix (wHTH) protein/TolB-like protein/Flp pilus assembly protein TadD
MSEREPSRTYEFGPFRLDPVEQQLWRDGEEIALTPKAFGVLLLLAKNSGHAVSKEDFMREVWANTIVEEKNLTDNISTLRQLLGDDAQNPTYIKTVPRRGYRFVADVNEITGRDTDVLVHESSHSRIVIEEEDEPTEVADISPAAFRFHAVPALPSGKQASPKWFWPLLIAGGLVLAGGIALVTSRFWTKPAASAEPAAFAVRTIAVLPFKPLVADASDPSLELGMTDALITKLSNIRQIAVRPTSSVLKYSAPDQDLKIAGKELEVDVLVDGKVQKAGDRVRLSVQLLRASDGTPFWGESFDENFTNVFALQDRVSERVAAALSLKLTGEEKRGVNKRYTESAEAYQLYLKGRHHWMAFRSGDLVASLNYYNEALKKDPAYALAYSGLSNSYTVISLYGPLPASEALPKAQEAAQKAVALDDNLAEAHASLGAVKIFYERDWPGAARELKRAMELDPNNMDAHELYAYYLQAMGKADEAVSEFKLVTQLAPHWSVAANDLLEGLFDARQYDEAINQSREIIRLEPNNPRANQVLGMALTQKKQFTEAIAALERAAETGGEFGRPKALTQLGYTYAVAGKKSDALRVIEELKRDPNPWLAFHLARIYVGLGDKEQAFTYLEKAADERFGFLYDIRFTSHFDPLRDDPRFAQLLQRINLSP